MKLTGTGVIAAAGLAAVGLVAFLAWRNRGAVAEVAAKAVDAVNPASSGNLVNQAVTRAGQAITGDKAWSLGSWLYDLVNPDDGAAAVAPTAATGAAPIYDRWDYAARAGTVNSGQLDAELSFEQLAMPDAWYLPTPSLGISP